MCCDPELGNWACIFVCDGSRQLPFDFLLDGVMSTTEPTLAVVNYNVTVFAEARGRQHMFYVWLAYACACLHGFPREERR